MSLFLEITLQVWESSSNPKVFTKQKLDSLVKSIGTVQVYNDKEKLKPLSESNWTWEVKIETAGPELLRCYSGGACCPTVLIKSLTYHGYFSPGDIEQKIAAAIKEDGSGVNVIYQQRYENNLTFGKVGPDQEQITDEEFEEGEVIALNCPQYIERPQLGQVLNSTKDKVMIKWFDGTWSSKWQVYTYDNGKEEMVPWVEDVPKKHVICRNIVLTKTKRIPADIKKQLRELYK